MRVLLAAAVLAGGCSLPTGPSSGHPHEDHVLAENDRFSAMLGVRVRGIITDEVYLVPASEPKYPGEKVPAGGWYRDGVARYWRPVIQERSLEYGTALAAHEVCHARHEDEGAADRCGAELMAR